MKYALIAAVVASLAFAVFACGCTSSPGEGGGEDDGIVERYGDPISLVEFSYTTSGSSADSFVDVEAVSTKGGVHLTINLINRIAVDVIADDAVMARLGEIAGRYWMDTWDGFSKTNRNVLDGESFSLRMVLQDGSVVQARGSNAFPESYGPASIELDGYIDELIERYESFDLASSEE